MATSTIFEPITIHITDPEDVQAFVDGLEASANSTLDTTPIDTSHIVYVSDPEEIKAFFRKRFPEL